MEGGTVLQMAEATPAHQGILWHIRERRQDADLCGYHCILSCGSSARGDETEDGYLRCVKNFEYSIVDKDAPRRLVYRSKVG